MNRETDAQTVTHRHE